MLYRMAKKQGKQKITTGSVEEPAAQQSNPGEKKNSCGVGVCVCACDVVSSLSFLFHRLPLDGDEAVTTSASSTPAVQERAESK